MRGYLVCFASRCFGGFSPSLFPKPHKARGLSALDWCGVTGWWMDGALMGVGWGGGYQARGLGALELLLEEPRDPGLGLKT